MNLKEAFRFQNKLTAFQDEAQSILDREDCVTRVTMTSMRSRILAGEKDEVKVRENPCEYADHITSMAVFLVWLLTEREKLSAAIYAAKLKLDLPAGLDGEMSLNAKRQSAAETLRRMAGIRSSETLVQGGGTGYRFNNDGNQVTYRCDLKTVKQINFDRTKVRRLCTKLSQKADEVSASLDTAVITTQVDYEAPFDVNDTFADVFENFAGIEA